jgi:hypothetical protein
MSAQRKAWRDGSVWRKKPRRARSAVTVAQAARTLPLATAIHESRPEVLARHKTRKMAMTTEAVVARMSTARRFVDMILPSFHRRSLSEIR